MTTNKDRQPLTSEEQAELDALWERDQAGINAGAYWRPGTFPEVMELSRGWKALYVIEVRNGRPEARELHLVHPDGLPSSGGLSTRLVREEIKVREHLDEATRRMRELHEAVDAETQGRWERIPYVQAALEGLSSRPGRRGHPDRFYAELAAAYVDRVKAGSRRPVADLAAQEYLSEDRVRTLVARARKKGFLTPAEPGKPGGELTARAEEMLTPPLD